MGTLPASTDGLQSAQSRGQVIGLFNLERRRVASAAVLDRRQSFEPPARGMILVRNTAIPIPHCNSGRPE